MCLGTWFQVMNDKLINQKVIFQKALSDTLYNLLPPWILIIFEGFTWVLKVLLIYLDLTTGTYIKEISNFRGKLLKFEQDYQTLHSTKT